jgi:hypothetical protein
MKIFKNFLCFIIYILMTVELFMVWVISPVASIMINVDTDFKYWYLFVLILPIIFFGSMFFNYVMGLDFLKED